MARITRRRGPLVGRPSGYGRGTACPRTTARRPTVSAACSRRDLAARRRGSASRSGTGAVLARKVPADRAARAGPAGRRLAGLAGRTRRRRGRAEGAPASARDPRRRAQLRHEAERGTRLVGPSLLTTYEFGEADGAVFMAMPLVVGCTLAEVLAQRRAYRDGRSAHGAHRLAVADDRSYARDVVALLARVARAAAGAHAGRVVHRDIKPGNILVRRDHAEGVYLCDFGLARDLDVATPGQLRDGAGSPLYMAPERLLKRPADEVRGDVYALGVTLFEALTLAPPVEVPDDLPPPLWARSSPPPSPRRPSSLWPAIPSALESTILRSISRDPAPTPPDRRPLRRRPGTVPLRRRRRGSAAPAVRDAADRVTGPLIGGPWPRWQTR